MKRLLLVFIATFSGIFGAFISPFYGLCVYLWFAYIRAQEWAYNVGWFNALRPSLLLAFFVIIASLFHRKKMFRLTKQSALMFLFWMWFTICHFNSINEVASAFWFDYFNKLMVAGFLISGLVNTKNRMIYIFVPFILSLGFYGSKSGLFGIINPGAKISQGPGGMLQDNNCFAMAFNMVLPFLFFGSKLFTSKLIKSGLLFLYYLTIFGVIFTYSRGGFLGLCVVLTLIQLKARKNIFILFLGGIFLSLSLFLFMPKAYKARISTIFSDEEKRDTSSSSRLHFWKVAIVMVNDHPIFGVGPGCYESAYNKYDFSKGAFGSKRAVHNTYLQMLSNNGYPGFILFILLIFSNIWICISLRRKVKNRRDLTWVIYCANTFEVATIGYCISCTFLSMAYADFIYHLFFLVIALQKTTMKYLRNPLVLCDSEIDDVYIGSLESYKCNTLEGTILTKEEIEAVTAVACNLNNVKSINWNCFEEKDFRDHKLSIIFTCEDKNNIYFKTEKQLYQYLGSKVESHMLISNYVKKDFTTNCQQVFLSLKEIKTFVDLKTFISIQQVAQNANMEIIYYGEIERDNDEENEISVHIVDENDLEEDDLWDILRNKAL